MSAAKKIAAVPDVQLQKNWNRKILVVDDEPGIRDIYKDMLAGANQSKPTIVSSRNSAIATNSSIKNDKFNFETVIVGSSFEALSAVQRLRENGESFAMGFFDVRLGEGMDGVELVREIQKKDPKMYAVFVTAYNDRTIDSIESTLGQNKVDRWDYMMKPFQSNEIIQKARNFVTLWNLQKENEQNESLVSDLNRRVLESERITSVAAVARGVAHEFGNLLMQIMGKAEVSLNKPETEMREALNRIIDASQRAHEILDRFNHLSDSKAKASVKETVLLNEIVDEALQLMAHQFKKSNVKICKVKWDQATTKIHSTSILQVLVNLFINALYAMKGSGQIDLSIVNGADHVLLIVRDYGTGIPEHLLEKVLEPFFTTKGDQGTGLGLAISKEIIEVDHAGEFRLANHTAKGLEVSIKLPKTEMLT